MIQFKFFKILQKGNSTSGSVYVIAIILLTIVFGFVLSNGVSPTNTPSLNSVPVTPSFQTPQSSKNSLQLNTFGFSTPMPTNTSTPPPGEPDFSSPSLDWDDVKSAVLDACTTISPNCKNELTQAAYVEYDAAYQQGSTFLSRAYLCSHNPSCEANGYDAYNGSTPLPVYVPDSECRQEYIQCIPNPALLKASCPEAFSTHCDPSDQIYCSNGNPDGLPNNGNRKPFCNPPGH